MLQLAPPGGPLARVASALAWGVVIVGAAVVLAAVGLLPAEISHGVPLIGLAAPVMMLAPAPRLRRVRLVLLGAIEASVLLLMGPDIGAFVVMRTTAPVVGERQVSLVELNIWDHNDNPERIIAWLRSTNADVIVLAEAREPFIDRLKVVFPDYPTFVTCEARPYCGTVILSRFPGRLLPGGWWVADGLRHRSDDIGMSLAAVELSIPDKAGHIQRAPVIATHLDRRGISGVADRQIAALIEATRQAAGADTSRLILAGDFNAAPWSPQMRRLGDAMSAVQASVFTASWPSAWPFLAIDHVYGGCRWRIRGIDAGPNVGSDHRPLRARLGWSEQTSADCV